MSETTVERRLVPDRLDQPLWRRLMRWETLLAAIAIAVFGLNSVASPYFLDPYALSDLTFTFTEKGLIALPMALLIISGEFDLSVAAIMALASTLMGMAAEAGAGTPLLVIIGVLIGLICGAGNGLLVAYFRLPSIVATIGTMSLFRGIAFIILGDQAYGKYPPIWRISDKATSGASCPSNSRSLLSRRSSMASCCMARALGDASLSLARIQRPLAIRAFGSIGSSFSSLLDRSHVGRRGGAHHLAPRFDTAIDRAGLRARRDHDGGLGGVSIQGGAGSIPGVVLAACIMGLVTFGLGLLNVPSTVMSIVVGTLLIVVIALPLVWRRAMLKRMG
jgi:rhamnose transport system permease protein